MRRAGVAIAMALALTSCVAGAPSGTPPATPSPIECPSPTPSVTPASPRPSDTPPASPSSKPTATPFSPTPTVTPSSPTPSAAPSSPKPSAGPTGLPASLLGVEWTRLPTSRKVVALTFDCGSNADGVASILRTLRADGVTATFFMTGRWIEAYPTYARTIAASYPVGNHTYRHPHLPGFGDAEVRDEILRAQRLIVQTLGKDPRPLFRFPYGDSDARTLRIINALGYGSIRWTVDTLGWKGTKEGQSVASILSRVKGALRPGAIVLMHVGSAPDRSTLDADALPALIRQIRAAGYSFVTVSAFTR